jgi:Na+/H+-dicarboxylate symporter
MVQRLVADERARGLNLETKTATLAGFTGAILALVVGLGRDLLDSDLGPVGGAVFRAFFLVAVLSLATGAVLAVLGVLRPQEHLAISRSEVKRFSEFPLIATARMEIQGRMMNTLIEAFERERRVNDSKARLTQYAAVALVVGLAAVAGEALTVVIAASW